MLSSSLIRSGPSFPPPPIVADLLPADGPVGQAWRSGDTGAQAADAPALPPALDVQVATAPEARRRAGALLERRYRWRGYGVAGLPLEPQPRRSTLAVSRQGQVLGTMTVGLDRAAGLSCDRLFAQEIDALRIQGLRLCEFKRLAVDDASPLRPQVLMALFRAAYEHARFEHGVDWALMEVNPRHVGYYRRRFGAKVLGDPRIHPDVGAPAVLLALDLAALERRAAACAAGVRLSRRLLPSG
jgi:hypothetical protein